MKKSKKIFKRLLILAIGVYVAFVLVNQQKTLNQYSDASKDLTKKIEEQKQYKEELAQKKNDVNSLDFIEQMAREKLDMYYPNEKVFVDRGV